MGSHHGASGRVAVPHVDAVLKRDRVSASAPSMRWELTTPPWGQKFKQVAARYDDVQVSRLRYAKVHRKTDRQTHTDGQKTADKHTDRPIDSHRQTNRQTDNFKETNGQSERQTGRQAGRQTDRQEVKRKF